MEGSNLLEIIIGWGLSIVAIVGGLIARDRALMRQISDGDAAVQKLSDGHVANLHERINKTRDEFVRRDALDGHLARIDKNIAGMYAEQNETNRRIDEFMATMVQAGRK